MIIVKLDVCSNAGDRLNCLNFAKRDNSNTLYVYISTDIFHLVDQSSGFPLPVLLWNPFDLSPFVRSTGSSTLNTAPDHLRVGDIVPLETDVDKLADALKDYT